MKSTFRRSLPLLLVAASALAQPVAGQLMNVALPELGDDKEMLVLEVNLSPGQASAPHRHNAHVFVYVIEGRVEMQVAGGEVLTLSPGEMFYENPDDIHTVSRKASDTEPAKFVVHILKTVGVPVTTPVSNR